MTIKQMGGIFGRNPTFNDVTIDGGIYFEDGQSGNLLDDYEEGVWTPAYTPATNSFGAITAVGVGRYTKIGRLVVANASIYTSLVTVGTASGTVYVTGLPFAVNSTLGGAGRTSAAQKFNLGTDKESLAVTAESGQSRCYFGTNTMNNSITNMAVGDLTAGSVGFANLMTFTITYEV